MAMNVVVTGHREWSDEYEEKLVIEEYDKNDSKVVIRVDSEDIVFDKKELLRAVRIMCEE